MHLLFLKEEIVSGNRNEYRKGYGFLKRILVLENRYRLQGVYLMTDNGRKAMPASKNADGALITEYEVFPGIDLIYYDMTNKVYSENDRFDGNILDINHCLEGRIEYRDHDSYYYLSAGDLAIVSCSGAAGSQYYPLGRYKGITVRIDMKNAPDCLTCILEDVDVTPSAIYEKFCAEREFYVLRENKSIEHIFSELYDVPESVRKGYFKVKILELMLFLSRIEPSGLSVKESAVSKVRLAKDAGTFIAERLDVKITIRELAMHFHVSETQLKNCFKAVYGMSVHSYIREQKMRSAAELLSTTDLPVLEIAGKYGFDNGSKFAKAFREVMGEAPNVYRTKSAVTGERHKGIKRSTEAKALQARS